MVENINSDNGAGIALARGARYEGALSPGFLDPDRRHLLSHESQPELPHERRIDLSVHIVV